MRTPALLLLTLLAGCVVDRPGAGAVTRECAGPEWEWATYKARIESAVRTRWLEFNTRERDTFLRAMNRETPVSGYMYDRVGYFRLPGAPPTALLVYLVEECVWVNGLIPEENVRAVIGSGRGASL